MSRTLIALSVLSTVLSVFASNLVTVQQDATGKGSVISLQTSTGAVTSKSDVSFTFDWPLVQMTHKTDDKSVYIITYPDGYPGPVLYLLEEKSLSLTYAWENVSYSFFDLQYSPQQSTLYGIYVSSTYGRVLSNFTADQKANDVSVNQLFTLPYMWYVNASSFHAPSCHYYALINNFPGKENSTLDQQIIVADFSVDASVATPEVNVLPISNPNGIVQFIAYSDSQSSLFFAGMIFNSTTVELGTLDTATGKIKEQLWTHDAVAAGPLVVSEVNSQLMLFVKSSTVADSWDLWALPFKFTDARAKIVQSYTGKEYAFFAAAIATA